jgi:hypothetical protein
MLNNLRPYNIKGQGNSYRKGLYPNHPFNTIQPINPSSGSVLNSGIQANDPFVKVTDNKGNKVNVTINDIPRNFTTFHSPDTNFRNPFLSQAELKLYGNLRGTAQQSFIEPDQHPKHKLLANLVVFPLILAGVAEAVISLIGKYEKKLSNFNTPVYPVLGAGITAPTQIAASIAAQTAAVGYDASLTAYFQSGAALVDALLNATTGVKLALPGINTGKDTALSIAVTASGVGVSGDEYTFTTPIQDYLPVPLKILGGINQITYYFSQGADLALKIIYAILPYREYALQMLAHGYYNTFAQNLSNELYRFKIADSFYLKNTIQDVKSWNNNLYRINNLKRQTSVVLRTTNGTNNDTGPYFIPNAGGYYDNSLVTLGTAKGNLSGDVSYTDDGKKNIFQSQIASHYGAIKVRLRNQYGQLDNIKQIPITSCEQKINTKNTTQIKVVQCKQTFCDGKRSLTDIYHKVINKTPVLFNGDVYLL